MLRHLTAALAFSGLAGPVAADVIGADDRVTWQTPAEVSHSVAALVMGAGDVICTATVIGPSHVLTAAHCVWDEDTGAPLDNLSVVTGLQMDLGYKPVSRYFAGRFFIPRVYIEDVGFNGPTDFSAAHDYAVIQVIEPEDELFVGRTIGMDAAVLAEPRAGDPLEVTGYAADGGIAEASQFTVAGGCSIVEPEAGNGTILHDCDTGPASSGMALTFDGLIVGVHVGASTGANRGMLFTARQAADVLDAANGYTDGFHAFDVFDVVPDMFWSVDLKNRCAVDILVSLAFRNPDGGLSMTEELRIAPGGLRPVPLGTTERELYISGRAVDGSRRWTGSEVFTDGEGREFAFVRSDIVTPRYVDDLLHFDC